MKIANPNIVSGLYSMTISGVNNGAPFTAYCDFTIDGGRGYLVIFNRYFEGFQAGPSPSEMSATSIVGTSGYQNDFRIQPANIYTLYGATKMAVYAVMGHTSAGGIQSGSTFRWVTFTMAASNMPNMWNNVYQPGSLTGVTWQSTSLSGNDANILSDHGTGGGVYQSSRSGAVNSYVLFEYCPVQGSDPNHYWMVGDGSADYNYYRVQTHYGAGGALYNRYGGIAIY